MVKLIISGRGKKGIMVPSVEITNHKSFKAHNNYNLIIEKTDLMDIDSSDSFLIKSKVRVDDDSEDFKLINTYIDFEDDETKDLFLFKIKRYLARNRYKHDSNKLRKTSRELMSEINQDLNLISHKSKIVKKEVGRL